MQNEYDVPDELKTRLFHTSLPYRFPILSLVKIGPVVLEEKIIMQDAQRTTHDDGRQTITIVTRVTHVTTWF